MRVGLNVPGRGAVMPESIWRAIERRDLGQITMTTTVSEDALERIVSLAAALQVHVRAPSAFNMADLPSHMLEFRTDPGERSLGECLERLRLRCAADRIVWVGGGELPPREWLHERSTANPELDAAERRAMEAYGEWWLTESRHVAAEFPGVRLAVTPLGQGHADAQWRWVRGLRDLGCFRTASALADHGAFADRAFDDPEWGARGLSLREYLPELGPVHNLAADDHGWGTWGPLSVRAAAFARYLDWCAQNGSFACVSLFSPRLVNDPMTEAVWPALLDDIIARRALPGEERDSGREGGVAYHDDAENGVGGRDANG